MVCPRSRVRFPGGLGGGFNPPNDFFDPRVSVDLSSWGIDSNPPVQVGQKMLHFLWFFPLLQPLCDPKICYKCVCGRGSAPDPAGGAHNAPQTPSSAGEGIPPPHTPPPSAPAAPRPSRLSATPSVFFYKSDTALQYGMVQGDATTKHKFAFAVIQ